MEWLLCEENVWSIELEYQVKKAITFDPSVGSRTNFTGVSRACFLWGSYGMLLGDKDVWSVKLEYWLKRAVTFDSTVGSCSNF